MRVIAGKLGGRLFRAPAGHKTHPMSDKVRGALFAILGDIDGLRILDAFAGSGALSFEAVSRGGDTVVAIEQDRQAQLTISHNIDDLEVRSKVRLIKASARSWLQTSHDHFDIVLLDPPYDRLQESLLLELATRVSSGGRLALSWPGKQTALEFPDFTKLSEKQYGDASLHIYQKSLGF